MSIKNPRYPHPDCGFAASEPNTLKEIFVVEFWRYIDAEEVWGWDSYSVHLDEKWARSTFEEVKRAHHHMRIRKVGQVLSMGTIIDHYSHRDDPKGDDR